MIPFTKVSGAGNDFIIIDNRADIMAEINLVGFIQQVCRRRQAVGGDGLMLVEESDRLAAKMRLYNADGSDAPMSGNGGRAFASFVYEKEIVKESNFLFETGGGDVEAWIEEDGVRLRLAPPDLIRLDLALNLDGVDYVIHGIEIQGTPHGVIYWENLDETPDKTIFNLGRKFRHHPIFERGANINFTEVLDEHTLRIRTYERGVEDETLACGTGSTGASVVSFLLGKVKPPVRIKTSSGEWLEVAWQVSDVRSSDLYLSGRVRHVVDGFILPASYTS
jgi:diaminopimelate epimerase